ncbi:MAG: hypothetical protein ACN6O2_06385 [Stenotrophomonas sp.]
MSYTVLVLVLMVLWGIAFECILRVEARRVKKMNHLVTLLAKAVADSSLGHGALAPEYGVAQRETGEQNFLPQRRMALRRDLMLADELSNQKVEAWVSPLHTDTSMDIYADPVCGLDLLTGNACDVGIWS